MLPFTLSCHVACGQQTSKHDWGEGLISYQQAAFRIVIVGLQGSTVGQLAVPIRLVPMYALHVPLQGWQQAVDMQLVR